VGFDCREGPVKSAIESLIEKFEQTGSMIDNRRELLAERIL
jgi:hypothetical protein